MKKLLLVISLLVATTANAQWNHYHRPIENRTVIVERNDRNEWIAPLIIGTIAGAVIANANQPIVQQQPVIVQQQPVIVQQPQTVCYGWKEIQTLDGQIYRERSCYLR